MKKQNILLCLGFILFLFIFSRFLLCIPFYIENQAYDAFVKRANEVKEKKVDKLTTYKDKHGVIYQTPEGNTFGNWKYDGFCIEQEYGAKKPVIKENCQKMSYNSAAKQIINTSSKKNLKNDTVETGLDTGKAYSSKMYFTGSNPDNYVYYSNMCFRVVSIAQNDTVKLVYEGVAKEKNDCAKVAKNNSGSIALLSWDDIKTRNGNFVTASTLRERLHNFYEEEKVDTLALNIPFDTTAIELADWYIGKVNTTNQTIQEDIINERSEITTEKVAIGLLNNSDYLKISCNLASGLSNKTCSKNNYLYKSKYQWWTINYGEEKNAWIVMPEGKIESNTIGYSHEYRFSGTRMSFYLKADTLLTGTGSEDDPYRVVK